MKRTHFFAILVCIFLVGAAYMAYRYVTSPEEAITRRQDDRIAPKVESAAAADIAGDAPPPSMELSAPPPPWMGKKADKSASASQTPMSAASDARKRQMTAAIDELQRLQKNEVTDPLQVVAALEKLEKANGSPIFHGTRLDVMRTNLELSQKMQVLAGEIAADAKNSNKSAPPSPEQQAQQTIKREQFQALAKQMRIDVTAPQNIPGNR